MRHRFARTLIATAVTIGIVVGLSSCGTPSAVSSTSTLPSTTTTLPEPSVVLATTATGAVAFEGRVSRVAVAPLANGKDVLPSRAATQHVLTGTVKIAFRQFGSGPNLVLAMGEHGSMSWWDPKFLQELAANYRVTIFDDPDVGYSAKTPRAPSVETDGDVLAGLIASLGLTNATVLGWGMGGQVALSLAERHAGLVIGLVLVDTNPGGPGEKSPTKSSATIFGSPRVTMQQLASVMFPETSDGTAAKNAWIADIALLAPDDVISTVLSGQADAERAFLRDDRVARLLTTISLPTLILQGADDTLVPEQNAELIHRQIKGSQLIIDPNSGYASLFQDEFNFLKALSTFAQSVNMTTTTTTSP
jgi:pimeloyl-ACP methyl ester carboxylesterase